LILANNALTDSGLLTSLDGKHRAVGRIRHRGGLLELGAAPSGQRNE
jgi:hypothetical protein